VNKDANTVAARSDGIDSDGIDTGRLTEFLRANVGGDGPVFVRPLVADTGVANTLYLVDWDEMQLVLRRPPVNRITASQGNVDREARLLAALANTDVRHPRLVIATNDESVIGSPFVLLQRVDGINPVDPLPPDLTSDASFRAGLGPEIIDALAELATTDWRAIGLEGFGKPDGFLARQVDRWLWQLDSYRVRPLPDADIVVDWLRANLPEPGPTGILHGDYSLFNVMFARQTPARLAAIIDWDTATIGEPLMDLGHVLARWDEPGEDPTSLGSADISDRRGLSSRAELAERFASRTGWDVSNVRYYEVVSLFKLGCIMEGHHANEMTSLAPGAEPRFATTAPGLFADAVRIIHGERA
jgi:aminoglycoside phosphotransferase (APT) family kinase protein